MRMILLFLIFMAIVLGPQLWVWWVFKQYRQHRDELPGTGGELARHLLNRFGLNQVRVEPTPIGDHYNPETKLLGLLPQHYSGKSLTAAVIAAHEVGHALQDHEGYDLLKDRTHLIKFAQKAEKAGSYLMLGIPVLAGVDPDSCRGACRVDGGNRDHERFRHGASHHLTRGMECQFSTGSPDSERRRLPGTSGFA